MTYQNYILWQAFTTGRFRPTDTPDSIRHRFHYVGSQMVIDGLVHMSKPDGLRAEYTLTEKGRQAASRIGPVEMPTGLPVQTRSTREDSPPKHYLVRRAGETWKEALLRHSKQYGYLRPSECDPRLGSIISNSGRLLVADGKLTRHRDNGLVEYRPVKQLSEADIEASIVQSARPDVCDAVDHLIAANRVLAKSSDVPVDVREQIRDQVRKLLEGGWGDMPVKEVVESPARASEAFGVEPPDYVVCTDPDSGMTVHVPWSRATLAQFVEHVDTSLERANRLLNLARGEKALLEQLESLNTRGAGQSVSYLFNTLGKVRECLG